MARTEARINPARSQFERINHCVNEHENSLNETRYHWLYICIHECIYIYVYMNAFICVGIYTCICACT